MRERTGDRLIVVGAKPHQTRHKRLRDLRAETKVEIWPVRAPQEGVVSRLCDCGMGKKEKEERTGLHVVAGPRDARPRDRADTKLNRRGALSTPLRRSFKLSFCPLADGTHTLFSPS